MAVIHNIDIAAAMSRVCVCVCAGVCVFVSPVVTLPCLSVCLTLHCDVAFQNFNTILTDFFSKQMEKTNKLEIRYHCGIKCELLMHYYACLSASVCCC